MMRLIALSAALSGTPLSAQDYSGLFEMANACLNNTTHEQYDSRLCDAFRYGIDYEQLRRETQLFRSDPSLGQPLLGVPRQGLGQTLKQAPPNAIVPQIVLPPSSLSPHSPGQVVR